MIKNIPLFLAMLFMCSTISFMLTPTAHAQNVIITGMEDYNFGTHTGGSGDKVQVRAVCVGKTSGNKNWSGTIVGSGTGGAYTLNDGSGNTVPFTIRRIPNPTYTNGVSANANQADNTAPIDCGGVDNQDIEITISGASLDGAAPGTYTGFIDFTVAP